MITLTACLHVLKIIISNLIIYTSMSKLEVQILGAFSSQSRTLQDMVLILLAKRPLHVGTQLQNLSLPPPSPTPPSPLPHFPKLCVLQ